MTSRKARQAAKRLSQCPTCRAVGSEMHHPACPYGLAFTFHDEDIIYCSCGERWTVFHKCEVAKT